MSDADTLETLKRVSRARPRERKLCCADCGGEIELRKGTYTCIECLRGYAELAELAVCDPPRKERA